ncbi:MAG: hypothetical protein JW827_08850 [Spirochaetes bacterium]|nr:hypothetical protein [Spirochaetota bacterium]
MRKILCLTLILTLIFFQSIQAQASKSDEKVKAVGKVNFIVGKAMIMRSGSKNWEALKIKTLLSGDDVIKTLGKSRVKIKLRDNRIIEVKSNKVIKIATLMTKSRKIQGSLNSVFTKMKKTSTKGRVGITAVAGVRGDDVSRKEQKVKPEDVEWSSE